MIKVIGKTSQQIVMVYSKDKPFVLDEYLIIEDESHDNPVGEIIESSTYPSIKSCPNDISSDILGDCENSPIHIGKLKILKEIQTPIKTGASVRVARYDEVEKLLMPTVPEKGFVLGVIKGTEDIQKSLPTEYQNIAPLFDSRTGISPQVGMPFILNHYAFQEYPHIGIFGGSGSGKSYATRAVCEEIMIKGIPGVVFDPHYELTFTDSSNNYPKELLVDFSNKHEVFQIGVNVGINFTEITTDELTTLMEFVADITPPMRSAIDELHQKNDSFTTLNKRVGDLRIAFENFEKPEREREDLPEHIVLLYNAHRNKISGTATLQAVLWRLDQLNKTGIFGCDVNQVEACILKRKLAVIRGKQKHLKMIASYLLRKLYTKRRVYKDWEQSNFRGDNSSFIPEKFPPFFIIIDEAHNFAPNGLNTNPTKQLLREISQEARKYGVFEVFGTQRPALLDTTIVAMLNTKIIFRTSIESDMQMIKTETNLNERQVSRLPELTSGNAFVSSATMRKTMYVRFRANKTISPHAEHPFDELDDFDRNGKLRKILTNYLPLSLQDIPNCHTEINKAMGQGLTIKEIEEALNEMVNMNEAERESTPFGKRYTRVK